MVSCIVQGREPSSSRTPLALSGAETPGVELGSGEVAAGVKSETMVLGPMIYDAEGVSEARWVALPSLTSNVPLAGLPKIPPVAPVAVMRFSALFWLVQVIFCGGNIRMWSCKR